MEKRTAKETSRQQQATSISKKMCETEGKGDNIANESKKTKKKKKKKCQVGRARVCVHTPVTRAISTELMRSSSLSMSKSGR